MKPETITNNEIPKYKKKSKKKGLPRSKHKHDYIVVLLNRPYLNQITQETTNILSVNEVCSICGRINDSLKGEEWYDTEYTYMGKYRFGKDKLNKKALALPKWYTNDFFDKFAYKKD